MRAGVFNCISIESDFSKNLPLLLRSEPADRVICSQDAHLTLNNAVEIIGKVHPDLSVKVLQAMDFGPNIGTLPMIRKDRIG